MSALVAFLYGRLALETRADAEERAPSAAALERSERVAQNFRDGAKPGARRTGPVRVIDHALSDDGGPFLGLGVSFFTALWRAKNDRARLEDDLAFLARRGFNYCRILSMVGYHPAWEGSEIAPVSFTNRKGKKVDAWPDYWKQLREFTDLAYDRFGLRTQITLFADAQLMPGKEARIAHMQKLLLGVRRPARIPVREQQ